MSTHRTEPADPAAPAYDAVEQSERLRAILNAAVDGIITIDERGRIESVNAATVSLFQYEPEELVGENVSLLMPSPYREQHDEYIAAYLRSNVPKIIGIGREVIGRRKDGTTFPMDLAVGEVRLPGRRMFTGIIRDLSQQKRTEAELAEEQRRIRLMVENLPAGAVYVDRIRDVLLCNRAFEEITGFQSDQLASVETCCRRLFGDRVDEALAEYAKDLEENGSSVRVWKIVRADQTPRTIEVVRYRYDDHEVWLVRDVTEERRANEEIRRERDFVRALLETTQAVVTLVDRHGVIARCNSAAERLVRADAGQLNGRNWDDVFVHGGTDSGRDVVSRLSGGEPIEGHLSTTQTADGKPRDVIWWGSLLADAGPVDEFAVLIGHDVTEFREAQRRALQSERLAAIGQMVAGLAHESRNALQRAQAGLDVLSLDVPESRASVLDKVRTALTDMSRLYEEVRGYAAPIQLRIETTSLRGVWDRAWKAVQETTGAAVSLMEAEDSPPSVPCDMDAYRIGQVFRNIFENAVAVSPPEGRVSIAARSDGPNWIVAVTDQGTGLTAEQKEHIFDPFFTTKQKGTGLGMAIASRIISAHGGSITAENGASGGAVVRVAIPRTARGASAR